MPRPRAKSVRFSDLDTFMGEMTPSPTHSYSTLSSPELSSPLSLSPVRLPMTPGELCGMVPSPIDGPLELDCSLTVPLPNHLPLFTYDLTRNPQGIGSHAIVPPLPQAALDRPAVTPRVAEMTIVIKAEAFQWSMEMKPKYSSGEHVTVKDVLYGIYNDLQIRLNPLDMQSMAIDLQQKVGLAYQRRCERLKKNDKRDEVGEGIKRIDFLYRDHRFSGLVFDPKICAWELKVEEHP